MPACRVARAAAASTPTTDSAGHRTPRDQAQRHRQWSASTIGTPSASCDGRDERALDHDREHDDDEHDPVDVLGLIGSPDDCERGEQDRDRPFQARPGDEQPLCAAKASTEAGAGSRRSDARRSRARPRARDPATRALPRKWTPGRSSARGRRTRQARRGRPALRGNAGPRGGAGTQRRRSRSRPRTPRGNPSRARSRRSP